MNRALLQSHNRANHKSRLPAILLFSLLLMLCALLGSYVRPAAAAGQFTYLITVDADGFARTNKPVEVSLNFTTIIDDQNGSGAFDPNSVRVSEIACNGGVTDANVPFQFDKASNYNASSNARGTLVFLMEGNTGAAETRCYHVDFDVTGGNPTPPSFPDQVVLTDGVSHKGYQSIRVVTGDAEYFYHKPGGGFATLFDANNNDWIDWNTASGGSGDFRGIPNMVHPNDGGFFHPGRNIVSTTVISDGPLKASFKSVSNGGGAWEVLWDVFPDYALAALENGVVALILKAYEFALKAFRVEFLAKGGFDFHLPIYFRRGQSVYA